jgi:penicillin-binding protein 2
MFNRALQGTYAPGSSFKPCTAIAGLSENKIDTGTIITCDATFTKYEEYGSIFHCWTWPLGRHGDMNVISAITNSCNVFFYTVGDYLQISLMAKYAKLLGLGESTGIELAEKTGVMTTDQYMQEKYGRDVYAGEAVQAAIGQAESEFTPLQLAGVLRRRGKRRAAPHGVHLEVRPQLRLRRDRLRAQAEGALRVVTEQEYWDAIHLGMRGVVTDPVVAPATTPS